MVTSTPRLVLIQHARRNTSPLISRKRSSPKKFPVAKECEPRDGSFRENKVIFPPRQRQMNRLKHTRMNASLLSSRISYSSVKTFQRWGDENGEDYLFLKHFHKAMVDEKDKGWFLLFVYALGGLFLIINMETFENLKETYQLSWPVNCDGFKFKSRAGEWDSRRVRQVCARNSE